MKRMKILYFGVYEPVSANRNHAFCREIKMRKIGVSILNLKVI